MAKEVVAYVGLGSNQGNRVRNLRSALALLKALPDTRFIKAASFHNTQPVGGVEQRAYLNTAAALSTRLSAAELFGKLQAIETKLGRARPAKFWGPRPIDLDLLLFGDRVIRSNGLVVPHPRLHERGFVLEPLAEIEPGVRHPVLKKTVRALLAEHRMKKTQVIKTVGAMREWARRAQARGERVGFVPTMGALHEGHLSLVRAARRENDRVVVSIFVNPTQFGPKEDFAKYPRDLKSDLELCRGVGVDCVFAPSVREMYPNGVCHPERSEGSSHILDSSPRPKGGAQNDTGECSAVDAHSIQKWVEGSPFTAVWEGASRPGFFRGVATVVAKLFNIVEPDRAYFGQKDAQQARLIQKMVEDLKFDVKVRVLPTIRELDGLALSSRNSYLSPVERRDALVVWRALQAARRMLESGVKDRRRIGFRIKKIVGEVKNARLDYAALVNPETFEEKKVLRGKALVLMAVWIGRTRLIDNLEVRVKG